MCLRDTLRIYNRYFGNPTKALTLLATAQAGKAFLVSTLFLNAVDVTVNFIAFRACVLITAAVGYTCPQ